MIIFTVEFYLYAKAYGLQNHLRTGWGKFDASIIFFGWFVLVAAWFEIPVPEWAAALARVLRLVRLGEKHPQIRSVLQTLGASFAGLAGALMLAGLAMVIFVLGGTLMFQPAEPFANIGRSLEHLTLLYDDAIEYYRRERDLVLGCFLVTYQVVMSLTIVNLIITVLIEGIQAGKNLVDRFATKGDTDALAQQLAQLQKTVDALHRQIAETDAAGQPTPPK